MSISLRIQIDILVQERLVFAIIRYIFFKNFQDFMLSNQFTEGKVSLEHHLHKECWLNYEAIFFELFEFLFVRKKRGDIWNNIEKFVKLFKTKRLYQQANYFSLQFSFMEFWCSWLVSTYMIWPIMVYLVPVCVFCFVSDFKAH